MGEPDFIDEDHFESKDELGMDADEKGDEGEEHSSQDFVLHYEISDDAREKMEQVARQIAELQKESFSHIAGIAQASEYMKTLTSSFESSESLRKVIDLQKTLVTAEMQATFAKISSVQSAISASWLASIQYDMQQILTNQTFLALGELRKSLDLNLRMIADTMFLYGRGFVDGASYKEIIASRLTPIIEALRHVEVQGVDWDEQLRMHEAWGDCGWVVFDAMPRSVYVQEPETWQQANRLARRVIDDAVVQEMKGELRKHICKLSDLEEAFQLYDEGRYKPCAMMLTSLIDCELYKKAKKPADKKKRRQSREPIRRLINDGPEMGFAVLTATGVLRAYDFFFGDGGDFAKDYRRELNRNFLMHGMFYGKVSRVSCQKLMVLLLSIARLMEWA